MPGTPDPLYVRARKTLLEAGCRVAAVRPSRRLFRRRVSGSVITPPSDRRHTPLGSDTLLALLDEVNAELPEGSTAEVAAGRA